MTSILEVETAGRSAPEGVAGFAGGSFLTGAAFTAASFDVDLWGIFLISLYRDCLRFRDQKWAFSNAKAGNKKW